MSVFAPLRQLDTAQRHTVLASFLGWILDAFDFFLLVFVLGDIASDIHVHKTAVTFAILLTLAARPLGALLFGRLADRFGRRPVLMVGVLLFSVLELACAFAPSLTCCWRCASRSASRWAGSGASAPRWRWRACRLHRAG